MTKVRDGFMDFVVRCPIRKERLRCLAETNVRDNWIFEEGNVILSEWPNSRIESTN